MHRQENLYSLHAAADACAMRLFRLSLNGTRRGYRLLGGGPRAGCASGAYVTGKASSGRSTLLSPSQPPPAPIRPRLLSLPLEIGKLLAADAISSRTRAYLVSFVPSRPLARRTVCQCINFSSQAEFGNKEPPPSETSAPRNFRF